MEVEEVTATDVIWHMTFLGITAEDKRDAGKQFITYFGIPAGQEQAAGQDILNSLNEGCEIILKNDLDEGREGCTSLRRLSTGLEARVGGHGWQGEWKPINQEDVLVVVTALAKFNRGGHWSRQGSIARAK